MFNKVPKSMKRMLGNQAIAAEGPGTSGNSKIAAVSVLALSTGVGLSQGVDASTNVCAGATAGDTVTITDAGNPYAAATLCHVEDITLVLQGDNGGTQTPVIINTLVDDALGIRVDGTQGAGITVITEAGSSITTGGNTGFDGIELISLNGADIDADLSGDINTSLNFNDGVFVLGSGGANIDVYHDGNIHTTGGHQAIGIWVVGGGENMSIYNAGSIITEGGGSSGGFVVCSSPVSDTFLMGNSGAIETSGLGSEGLMLFGRGVTGSIVNSGEIVTSSRYTAGIAV